MKNLLISVAIFSLTIPLHTNALQGDVHGRNLGGSDDKNIVAGWLGHIGIESSDSKVLEMLGEKKISSWGHASQLHKNSKNRFKTSSQYWGARYWNWLVRNQFWRVTNYIVPNADFIEDVGANYTTTVFHNHPYYYKDSRGKWRLKLGRYRCDTYTKSMYNTGGIGFGAIVQLPRKIYYAFPNQR
uniref:Uncharacterized protein n=1 Tax=Candidatus Kentrum sp. SD TaxID=2126332 RepID=A0A450YEA4_9GAMM|nr:MAG: hypothetical protein BECKSD772F_GA0070984_10345 [Candidatus Kentron sp. SD]VFK39844.1 MAG: hypothetical protein BECKSD772E_GA0070983_100462 [Candidatus Kentron sp. SD]VFK79229.1 MAG: hypothetical protein BECKSD772D_GA0070982_10419 [Candidatus Kentron sp. SD]